MARRRAACTQQGQATGCHKCTPLDRRLLARSTALPCCVANLQGERGDCSPPQPMPRMAPASTTQRTGRVGAVAHRVAVDRLAHILASAELVFSLGITRAVCAPLGALLILQGCAGVGEGVTTAPRTPQPPFSAACPAPCIPGAAAAPKRRTCLGTGAPTFLLGLILSSSGPCWLSSSGAALIYQFIACGTVCKHAGGLGGLGEKGGMAGVASREAVAGASGRGEQNTRNAPQKTRICAMQGAFGTPRDNRHCQVRDLGTANCMLARLVLGLVAPTHLAPWHPWVVCQPARSHTWHGRQQQQGLDGQQGARGALLRCPRGRAHRREPGAGARPPV